MDLFTTLVTTLRTAIPEGGTLHTRYATDGPEDYPNYLYVEQVAVAPGSDRDDDLLPEQMLGQETSEKVDSLLNECREKGLLVGYTEGDKFYDLAF
jgi:hypothetical protein